MSLNTEIIDFLRDSATKVGELSELLLEYKNKGYARSGKYWETVKMIKKLTYFNRALYEATVNIVDSDDAIVYNFLYNKTDSQIRDFMSKARDIGKISNVPFARFNFRDTSSVVSSASSTTSQGIPEGGAENYYLTKDANGNLVWKLLPTVIDGGILE